MVDDWNYKWSDEQQVSFAFQNWYRELSLRWVGFEDVRSIEAKVKYLMDLGLGGATVFSLDKDDFDNSCDQGKFPLLRVVNFHMNKNIHIEYPDAERVFNTTWEKSIQARREKVFIDDFFVKGPNDKKCKIILTHFVY